jgi:predicted transcriptional regulator
MVWLHYHNVLYNIANDLPQTLTPQALHQVKKGLLDMGYLQKIYKGNYKIIDNFLEVYLLNNSEYLRVKDLF